MDIQRWLGRCSGPSTMTGMRITPSLTPRGRSCTDIQPVPCSAATERTDDRCVRFPSSPSGSGVVRSMSAARALRIGSQRSHESAPSSRLSRVGRKSGPRPWLRHTPYSPRRKQSEQLLPDRNRPIRPGGGCGCGKLVSATNFPGIKGNDPVG